MGLNKEQYSELQRIIEDRCVALADEIRVDALRVREDSRSALAGGMDSADAAATDQIVGIDNAELDRDLRELRELEAAQARFDAGTFGKCIDCHKEIEYPRLRAQPGALRCIDCQRIYENTHAHTASPKL